MLFNSVATNNLPGTGIEAQGGSHAVVFLCQSNVTDNGYGYQTLSGGQVLSSGDNYIISNNSNTGSLTSFTKQ